MSVKVMGLLWDLDLPPSDKLVALALADHADHDGNRAYPSVPMLAYKVGLGTTQTRAHLRALEGMGVIVRVNLGKGGQRGGRGIPTEYRFDMDLIEAAARTGARLSTQRSGVGHTAEKYPTESGEVPNGFDEVPNGLEPSTQRPTVDEPSGTVIENHQETSLASRAYRDGIFELLFTLETHLPYSTEAGKVLTSSARGALNRATKDVCDTGVTRGELAHAIASWPMVMDDALCTATGVAKHLPRLLAAARGSVARASRPSREQEVLDELAHRRQTREAADG